MGKLLLASIIALIAVLIWVDASEAHLVAHPKNHSLAARLVSQNENLAHARYVCVHGGGQHQTWACKATAWIARELRETKHAIALQNRNQLGPIAAIQLVWGPNAWAAIKVASCETGGTMSIYARNGQYLGLFQMGTWARTKYGHGTTAYQQARAAYANYQDNGWTQWECAYLTGII